MVRSILCPRTRLRHCFVICLVLLVITGLLSAARETPESLTLSYKSLDVLFIGNSYTYVNSLPWVFERLSDAGRAPARTQMVVKGGATLQQHWEEGKALEALKRKRWDYVVLQEQSLRPLQAPELMRQYARLFHAEIRKIGAGTVFFMTWARQNQPENQEALALAYLGIAREFQALVVPVGQAWHAALREKPSLELYQPDGSHPNPAGTYLAACVFFASLHRHNPVGLLSRIPPPKEALDDASPLVLDEAASSFLQRIAWESVESMVRVSN